MPTTESKPEQGVNRTSEDYLKIGSGGIGFIVGLLLVFKQINDIVSDFNKATVTAPLAVWTIFLLIITIRAAAVIRDGLAKRSSLLVPSGLILRKDNSELLVGRDSEIGELAKLCRHNPQVHLIGTSGVGKSALLQAGLLRRLSTSTSTLVPVYIESWGNDWEADPWETLSEAFWNALSDLERTALGLTRKPAHGDVADMLTSAKEVLGRTPLIICDQFDDYLVQHYYEFKCVNPDEQPNIGEESCPVRLTQKSEFWSAIAQLQADGYVKLLFAVRSEIKDWLQLVEFRNAKEFHLSPIEERDVLELLEWLTKRVENGAQVVTNPEGGWRQLKQRLVQDLSENSRILPVKLSIALEGIQRLPALTVAEYNLAGGVRGLQSAAIDYVLTDIAGHTGLSVRNLSILLKTLVEPDGQSLRPATLRTFEETTAAESNQVDVSRIRTKVQTAVDQLEVSHLIRKSIGSSETDPTWTLDGVYLGRAVLDSGDVTSNRWNRLLQQLFAQYKEVQGNPVKSWWRLVSPSMLVMLIYQRLCRHIVFGPQRRYVALSTFRLIPYLLPALLIAYCVASETAYPLPGAAFTRDFLYYHRISITRHVYTETEVQQRASHERRDLIAAITHRNKDGWITQQGPNERTDKEAWIQGQAAFSVLSSPELAQDHAVYLNCLRRLFRPRGTYVPKYGWLRDETKDYTIAEPALWTIAALATVQPTLSNAGEDEYRPYLAQAEQAAVVYSPIVTGRDGGWNMFPNQAHLGLHSTYTSTLALLALLELDKQGCHWSYPNKDSGDKTDELLNMTVAWLQATFHKTANSSGWAATERLSATEPIQEGLTYQIFAELLRCKLDRNTPVREDILREVPVRLEVLDGRSFDYETLTYKDWSYKAGVNDTQFTNHQGKTIQPQFPRFRYAWYPWSIYCATYWLRYADKNPRVNWRDVARVRRIRDHLIMDLGSKAIDNFQQETTFTFQGTELLYALSAIPEPTTPEPPGHSEKRVASGTQNQ